MVFYPELNYGVFARGHESYFVYEYDNELWLYDAIKLYGRQY